MEIQMVRGNGIGSTSMAAFDAALKSAGIHDYNIIKLSSILPAQTDVKVINIRENIPSECGYRLYVVLSDMRQVEKGKKACAGIGWVSRKDKSGGMFVEHTAEDHDQVVNLINLSLTDFMNSRGDVKDYDKIEYLISDINCDGSPVCALVAAVFKSEGWV